MWDHRIVSTCGCNIRALYFGSNMDSFQPWKDDYRREVDEVLASRRRARERGEPPESTPADALTGRLSDLVIPPAGVYAEAAALKSRLEDAQARAQDARRSLAEAEAAITRERERRDAAAAELTSAAERERASAEALSAAKESAARAEERAAELERLVADRAAAAQARIEEAREQEKHALNLAESRAAEAEEARRHAAAAQARAADAELESASHRQSAKLLQARLEELRFTL